MGRKKKIRNTYSIELKKKAVAMSNQEGISLADVADQLGVPAQQLSQWRSKFSGETESKSALLRLDALGENKKLKEELKQLRMENDILKKAAVFFASQK